MTIVPIPAADNSARLNIADTLPNMPMHAARSPCWLPFRIAKKTAGPGLALAMMQIVAKTNSDST